jgi:hypothetical protein
MTHIVSVGPDSYDPYEGDIPSGIDWIVYWYQNGDYDGSGSAYAYGNGKYYTRYLGHCSCYGPWDLSERAWSETNIAEIDRDLGISTGTTNELDEQYQALAVAIIPLLGIWPTPTRAEINFRSHAE